MNRRKFIKAISMLAGALFVAPKALFAKVKPEATKLLLHSVDQPSEGLTMAKLLKAKKIMDAQAKSGSSYVWVNV